MFRALQQTISVPPVMSIGSDFSGYFSLNDLPLILKDRILKESGQLQKGRLPQEVFLGEPNLPTFESPKNIDSPEGEEEIQTFVQTLDQYLWQVGFSIVEFSSNNPNRAYVFLSLLLDKIFELPRCVFERIEGLPSYLRIYAQFVTAGTDATQYSSMNVRMIYITSLVERFSRRADAFRAPLDAMKLLEAPSDNLVVLGSEKIEDHAFAGEFAKYRRSLLNILSNLCDYYRAINDYQNLKHVLREAVKYAQLFHSSQIQFDVIISGLAAYIEGDSNHEHVIANFQARAEEGIGVLRTVYGGIESTSPDLQKAENKLNTYKLLSQTKKLQSQGCSIEPLAELNLARETILQSGNFGDGERAVLAQTEVILYSIVIQNPKITKDIPLQIQSIRDDESITEGDKAVRIRRLSLLLIWIDEMSSGKKKLQIEELKGARNSRLFLGALVELFVLKVNALGQSGAGKSKSERKALEEMCLEIYLIGVGRGANDDDKIVFHRPFLNAYTDACWKLFGQERSGDVTKYIAQLKEQYDERLKRDVDFAKRKLKEHFPEIKTLEVSFRDDTGKTHDYKIVRSDEIREERTEGDTKYIEHGGNRYTIHIITTPGAIDEEFETQLIRHLERFFMANLERYFRDKEWNARFISAQHTVGNILAQGSTAIHLMQAVASTTARTLLATAESPTLTLSQARATMIQAGQSIERVLTAVRPSIESFSGAQKALRATIDEVTREEYDVSTLIRIILRTFQSQSDLIEIREGVIEDGGISLNFTLFQNAVTDIIQNTIRYKKDEQKRAGLAIGSYRGEEGEVVLVFRDYGKGVSADRIKLCLEGRTGGTPDHRSSDSLGHGFNTILNLMIKHRGRVEMESNLDTAQSRASDEEIYTEVRLVFPPSAS